MNDAFFLFRLFSSFFQVDRVENKECLSFSFPSARL